MMIRCVKLGDKVRPERRWTSARATPARKLDRSIRWQSKSVVSRQGTAQFVGEFPCDQPGGTSSFAGGVNAFYCAH
jgi:hypothetical protein